MKFLFLIIGFGCFFNYTFAQSQQLPTQNDILNVIDRVNNNWQKNNSPLNRAFWDNAAYHTGNMAAYKVTGNEKYLNYTIDWANFNNWMGAKSTNKENWKYDYGEDNDHVLFGDWQICFQSYIDLFNYTGAKDTSKIARAIEVMQYEMATPNTDYWWWADGLYMVMPVMTKLYKVTNNHLYLDKLYQYFSYAKSIMYDNETGLFYRDARYTFPKHQSVNNKKDFWARGDGWVFAGLAKVLTDMPNNFEHKEEFKQIYIKMAQTLKDNQQKEGYWTRSILDPEHAPGPETSGTAFFTYGFIWGINQGILSKEEYLPIVINSWNYLINTAIDNKGNVGYVQPIGDRAIPGQIVNQNSTSNFGVGAVLLVASEYYKFIGLQNQPK